MVKETCKLLGIKQKELFELVARDSEFQDIVAGRWERYYNTYGIMHPNIRTFCERTLNAQKEGH